MSVLIDYKSNKDPTTGLDFGYRSGNVYMKQQKQLDENKKKAYRVIRVILSPEIPNIYTYGSFTNAKVNISNDGGMTWVSVNFKNGIYTIQEMQDSINDVANQLGWYSKSTEPALILSYNPATRMIYTKIDSGKMLLPSQFAIDYAVSLFYQMLGYTSLTCTFLTDGLFTASLPPQVDTQSTYLEIFITCIQGTRWVNGNLNSSIARIPISTSSTATEIVFPSATTGYISPTIPALIPSTIESFDISIRTGNGAECVFLYGNCIIEVEIMDI